MENSTATTENYTHSDAEIQSYYNKLKGLEEKQVLFKEINNAYRKWKKDPRTLDNNTILSEASKKLIIEWVPRYSYEKQPIEGWQMTNNNATIKNTKERIKTLESKYELANKANGENPEFPFDGGKVVLNHQQERVQIFYDQKPTADVCEQLKRRGFKWSYTNEAWQRMITNATFYDVQTIVGVVMPRI